MAMLPCRRQIRTEGGEYEVMPLALLRRIELVVILLVDPFLVGWEWMDREGEQQQQYSSAEQPDRALVYTGSAKAQYRAHHQ